jgi:hypothetical protein
MKLVHFFFTFLILLCTTSLRAQEEGGGAEAQVDANGELHEPVHQQQQECPPCHECDCNEKILAATDPLARQVEGHQVEVERMRRAYDDEATKHAAVMAEVKTLRESLAATRAEASTHREAVENEKKHKEDALNQVRAAQAKIAALQADLDKAKKEAAMLADVSILHILQKNIMSLWEKIMKIVKDKGFS